MYYIFVCDSVMKQWIEVLVFGSWNRCSCLLTWNWLLGSDLLFLFHLKLYYSSFELNIIINLKNKQSCTSHLVNESVVTDPTGSGFTIIASLKSKLKALPHQEDGWWFLEEEDRDTSFLIERKESVEKDVEAKEDMKDSEGSAWSVEDLKQGTWAEIIWLWEVSEVT